MLTKALCIITNNMISPAALTMRVYVPVGVVIFISVLRLLWAVAYAII
jgi:hypothetical protein